MFSIASPTWMHAVSTWLPSTAVRAGAPPSNGTASASTSLVPNVRPQESWEPVPTPVVP